MRNIICASALLISVAVPVTTYGADASLAAARDLYVSASYDDALAMLGTLSTGSKTMEERQTIDLYRTLCLFALGKTTDADRVIEGMLLRDPRLRRGIPLRTAGYVSRNPDPSAEATARSEPR